VWLENFFYGFPIWACLAIAFIPAAITALVMRPFAKTLVEDQGTTVLRDRVFGLASTAFVFVVALSTNTLWQQDVDVASAAREMVVSGQEVVLQVEQEKLPNRDEIVEALNDFLRAVNATETQLGPLLGTPEVNSALEETRELIYADPDLIDKEGLMDAAFQQLVQDRGDYLSALNQPGIPDILWVAVIILGLLLIATFALYPIARSRRFSTTATAVAVFAVGLIQLPMWVLNSSTQVEKMVQPYLADGVGEAIPTDPPIVGQMVAAIVVAGIGAAIAVGLFYFGRRKLLHHEAHPEEEYFSQHDLLTQIRDSLKSMEGAGATSPSQSEPGDSTQDDRLS
jgi:hypothetical protein